MSKRWKTAVALLLLTLLALSGLNTVLLCQEHMRFRDISEPQTALSGGASVKASRLSMFSWEDAPYRMETRAAFYGVLDALDITAVYQSFEDERLYEPDVQSFLHQAGSMGIDVYYLTGTAAWGLEQNAQSMLTVIDQVAAYNAVYADAGTFPGIVFDVEPYLTAAWKQDDAAVMQTYSEAMRTAYVAASRNGLQVILCIPNWFDSSHAAALETLIAECCDMVSVMNYNRDAEVASIRTETMLAKQYQKPIECIFEFQQPGKHDLTDRETYFNAGLDAALDSFTSLREQLGYDRMSFSYHYYQPVKTLYRQGGQ